MKTEKYYLDKIAKAESVLKKHKELLEKFKNPPLLKVVKGKTKVISFRVPSDRADYLKQTIAKLLRKEL